MGQKYAAMETQGNRTFIVFYDSDKSPVPADVTDAVAITDEQWLTCINSLLPYSVVGGALVAPTDSAILANAKSVQIAALNTAYQAAITAPVSFTNAAGVTATYNQDATAKGNLQDALLSNAKSEVWALNLWVSVANQPITPFTYADLQGLAAAMEAADAPAYQDLLTLIAEVNAATTVAAVQAVVWS